MEIEFKNHVTAKLISVDGDESRIVQRARVSTQTDLVPGQSRDQGLLKCLVRERHGSPFESVLLSWEIEAPIFVAREAVRHRLANWNEESGRYVELRPIFYVPGPERHLRKVEGSKQMAYATEAGTSYQVGCVEWCVMDNAERSWENYQYLLDTGILREVARIVLPLNIMTHWHWTMNVRALTNFLSLRVRHPDSHIESKPQVEIQMLAEQMEKDFARNLPTVYEAWAASGRLPL